MTKHKAIIYIVDDDASVCRSLTLLLKSYNFQIETFTQAEDFMAFRHPKATSCLILDLCMPHVDGLTLQEMMAAKGLTIPIVFISGRGDIPRSVKAMKKGAIDFLPKPFTDQALLEAIDRAMIKDRRIRKNQDEKENIWRRIKTLSPRELEVFRLVANGMLSKQIAVKCKVSLQTIKVHRSRVMQKMQAKTITELIHFAQKSGLTTPRQ